MVTRVRKWGNSQGLRIAKSVLDEVGIHVGDQVRISIRDRRLVVEPAATVRGRYDLRALVANMQGDYRVGEEDWGPPGSPSAGKRCSECPGTFPRKGTSWW